ncbi:class I SAM-dependent methyltransferase [Leptolyngbya sp. NIES-2104]|uniref:class I SAM-dependent methyltransferase n=1 Tax=Leptolyngbya sp. NIES-2104 TaxID=1552121 RepID=UPI0021F16C4D|nr:class I SAM-dependent methyltransferase [Leptolyngbya sp. NIES-2104]
MGGVPRRLANAEATELPDGSFDLVTLQFVVHELPRTATIAIFQEAFRLLRPGGHRRDRR